MTCAQRTDVQIRKMSCWDLNEILAIERQSFPWPWAESTFRRALRASKVRSFVARNSRCDCVVGYMVLCYRTWSVGLENLAVGRDWRRQGIGTKLMEVAARKLRYRPQIYARVREGNVDAQCFFRAHGFRAISILRNYYDDTDEPAYVMVLERPKKP